MSLHTCFDSLSGVIFIIKENMLVGEGSAMISGYMCAPKDTITEGNKTQLRNIPGDVSLFR